MSLSRRTRVLFACLAGLGSVFSACNSGGLIGGECRFSLSACGNECVSLGTDTSHCGTCGHACDLGQICRSGACFGSPDDDLGRDSGVAGAPPVADAGAGGSTPILECASDELQCGDYCANLDTDANHCGRCFRPCPSGLCDAAECVGVTPGHLVLMCMSFDAASEEAPQTTLLGNAVFVAVRDEARILAYDHYATTAARNGVAQTLNWAKGIRSLEMTSFATEADVINGLRSDRYNVFLALDQSGAPRGTLATMGANLRTTLLEFTQNGGTTIVLASTHGTNEMDTFLVGAGLLSEIEGLNQHSLQVVYNRAPTDSLGQNVLNPFLSLIHTCTLTTPVTPDAETVFVVTDQPSSSGQLGNPMVIHRVLGP